MKRWIVCLLSITLLLGSWKWGKAQQKRNEKDCSSLSFQVSYVYRPGGVGKLKPIKNGDVLQSGDHYKIVFTPDMNCYVYIFQVDSSGHIFELFPMKSFKGVPVNNFNPVKQGKTYILPSPDKAFVLDRKTGIERIYFFASMERNMELEGLYAELQEAVRRKNSTQSEDTRSKLNKYFRRRGIKVVPSEQHTEVPWRETGDVFSVISQRLEDLGGDSLHKLEFIHK